MEEDKSGGSGCGESSSRVSTSPFVVANGRQRLAAELRPGETTIVSWKKLAKDASKVDRPVSAVEPPPSNAHTVLESRLAPGQPAENEVKDAPTASRFGAVIEKIERLYMGKHSSDEDLNDVPDDEYDTEDSFIDDTELDEYFQVDNFGIKHDGFFVNRGKLERINEPTSLSNQQLKKRRRKDLPKGHSGGDDVRMPNKHVKVGKKAVGSSVPLVGKNSSGPSHVVALPSVHHEAMKFQNQIHSSVNHMKKKSAETKTPLGLSPPLKVSKGDGSLSIPEEKDIVKQKKGMSHPKYRGSKFKDGGEFYDASVMRPHGKSSHAQHKLSNNVSDIDQAEQKEKDGIHERLDLNVSAETYSMHTM